MKKFYSILASAALASTLTASADIVLTPEICTEKFDKGTTIESLQSFRPIDYTPTRTPVSQTGLGDLTDGEDTNAENWESMGTGAWMEGPCDVFTWAAPGGAQWSVEVEKHKKTNGYYRLQPYNENSILYSKYQETDPAYVYIHAEKPDKVYTVGDNGEYVDFTNIGIQIYQNCQESHGGSIYGTLSDLIITFPAGSHHVVIPSNGGEADSNHYGKFKIFLPGAKITDYSFETNALTCADDNILQFAVTKAGPDVASLKYGLWNDYYTTETKVSQTETIADLVNASSKVIEAGGTYSINTSTGSGIFTLILTAADADGNLVAAHSHHFYICNDNADQWKSLGTGTLLDPIIISAGYLRQQAELEVEVQENISTPGYFRIVNPYAEIAGEYAVEHGHKHYIYINATDPDHVIVEQSPAGLDINGAITVGSVAVYTGASKDQLIANNFGIVTYDATTRTIDFPKNSLIYLEKNTPDDDLGVVNDYAGKLTLPDPAGVDEIDADNSDAPVEYFNLQGIRVDNPDNGLYIRRQGNKAEKVIL